MTTYSLRDLHSLFRDLTAILPIVGMYLVMLSLAMLPPAIVGLWRREPFWWEFLVAFLMTFITGMILKRFTPQRDFHFGVRSVFLLTSLVWIIVSVFASVPFVLVEHISFSDAFFETVSGVTTTGSTVLSGLDHMSHSLLLWRSLLNWLGGIGFVVTGIAVLPFLNVGGMRLFRSESSDWSDRATPRMSVLARKIVVFYVVASLLCAVAYFFAGMSVFDAINHAMSTLSTGGFSTSDGSLGSFSASSHWVAVVFMIVGSLPFMLITQEGPRRFRALFADQQVRGFLLFLLWGILILASWLTIHSDYEFPDALRLTAVNVVSVVSTTGYAVTDYSQWGAFAVLIFFFLTFVGGCSGSTSGGIKIFRFQLAGLFLRHEMTKLLHPSAVICWKFNRKVVGAEVIQSLIAFTAAFLLTIIVIAMLLAVSGLDLLTSLTGAMTAVANVGPGFGDIIGPAGNFAQLSDYNKWVLSLGMLLGRLEILTLAVIFFPGFWRR